MVKWRIFDSNTVQRNVGGKIHVALDEAHLEVGARLVRPQQLITGRPGLNQTQEIVRGIERYVRN